MGRVTTPYEGSSARPWRGGRIPAPLRLHQATVREAWVDYNGHLTESAYLLISGGSSDAFFRSIPVHRRDPPAQPAGSKARRAAPAHRAGARGGLQAGAHRARDVQRGE